MVSVDDLKKILSYSPETGDINWISSNASWVKCGYLAGSKSSATGYIYIGINGKKYKAHRIAWAIHFGEWPKVFLDHVNGNRGDNRIVNLRLATGAENQQNRAVDKRNKSGCTGVSWDKGTKKWRAKICIGRKQMHIGVFDSKEEAYAAYLEAKSKLHQFNPVPRGTMQRQ